MKQIKYLQRLSLIYCGNRISIFADSGWQISHQYPSFAYNYSSRIQRFSLLQGTPGCTAFLT